MRVLLPGAPLAPRHVLHKARVCDHFLAHRLTERTLSWCVVCDGDGVCWLSRTHAITMVVSVPNSLFCYVDALLLVLQVSVSGADFTPNLTIHLG
jgi:hypothetical protein